MRIPDKTGIREHCFAFVNQRRIQPFLFQFSLMPLSLNPSTFHVCVCVCVHVCVGMLGRHICVIMSETKNDDSQTAPKK